MVFASLLFYISFGYDLPRTDFFKLATLYSALFFLCYKLIQYEKWNFGIPFVAGILFRLTFLFAEPGLSQDFYRFVWDGQLICHGINPYLYIPKDLITDIVQKIPNAAELYNGMGELSASHYSNYPPLNQLIFAFAALLTGGSTLGSVLVMRIIIIWADLMVYYFGRKLLLGLNRPPHLIFWYFLNPLVILELSGNLHFEGVMLGLFIGSLYYLTKKKWALGAVFYALSISIKLIPLIFLPLFIKYFGIRKSIRFFGIIGGVCLLLLLCFYIPQFFANYSRSIGLWFSNFEFNAGFYNLVKHIGIQWNVRPWELIKTYGKVVPLIVIPTVALVTFVRKNQRMDILITSMLWILALYYFLSATVHPWYVIFLVLLCLFTPYKFPIVWSLTIILSYEAYSNEGFKENLLLLFIEYIAVYGFMIYEIVRLQNKKPLFHKN